MRSMVIFKAILRFIGNIFANRVSGIRYSGSSLPTVVPACVIGKLLNAGSRDAPLPNQLSVHPDIQASGPGRTPGHYQVSSSSVLRLAEAKAEARACPSREMRGSTANAASSAISTVRSWSTATASGRLSMREMRSCDRPILAPSAAWDRPCCISQLISRPAAPSSRAR